MHIPNTMTISVEIGFEIGKQGKFDFLQRDCSNMTENNEIQRVVAACHCMNIVGDESES